MLTQYRNKFVKVNHRDGTVETKLKFAKEAHVGCLL